MNRILSWIGYDPEDVMKHRFTYIINGFSLSLVLMFFVFYIVVVKSALVNVMTTVCLMLLLSVFYFLKKKMFLTANIMLLLGFLLQEFSLVFLWFPKETNFNYFFFIVAPISFFVSDFSIRRERIYIICANTIAVILIVASEIVEGLNLVIISESAVKVFGVMSVLSTIASITVVFYFYAKNLLGVHNDLLKLAGTDSLTGIANRRILFDEGKSFFNLSRRYQRYFSLMIFDIDHFKVVNDTYGHPSGDRVLADVADLIRSHIRKDDFCSRYGGEEFAIILKDADYNGNVVAAENIRTLIESTPFTLEDGTIVRITISVGITYNQEEYQNFDEMVQIADKALYEAKSNGRNQVISKQ